MISSSPRATSFVETFLLTMFFNMASEKLFQDLPGLAGYSVVAGGAARLLLFAAGCIAFGYWLNARISQDLFVTGYGMAAGVVISFAHRIYLGEMEMPCDANDIMFTLLLMSANWMALFAGAMWFRRTRHQR